MDTVAPSSALRSAPSARERAPTRKRSVWWVVHHWTGLKLGLFMTWVLLTGTLSVFAVEYDWLSRPAMRVMPSGAPHASWGTLAQSAQQAVPRGTVTAIYAPPHAWFAAEAMAKTDPKRQTRIYLNPHDGQVQGTGPWLSFHRFFREMHRHLLLPAKWGIPIVSSLSLLLFISLVTGLVSYKKFWRGFLKRPRTRNARTLMGDLHRLGGLWSSWFVALIALTGAWYLVESLGGEAPSAKEPVTVGAPPPINAATIDQFAATARRVYPGLDIRELRLAAEPGEAIGFFGQADVVLVRDRANGVWIDPANGAVLKVIKGETLTAHQRISEAADPLHFGTWGGMTTKIIWFLFGALMTALSATGVMIFSLRLKTAYDDATAAPGGGVARTLRGMGVWLYPAAGLVLLSLAMLPGWLAG